MVWAAFDSPQSSAVVWLFPPRVVVMLERDFRNFAILISPRYLKGGPSKWSGASTDVARAKQTRSCKSTFTTSAQDRVRADQG